MAKNRQLFLFLFTILLATDLLAIYLNKPDWRYVSKILLVPALSVYFVGTMPFIPMLKNWIIAALFFSWVGDVFLLLPGNPDLYFIIGLACFLVAHICFSWGFHLIKTTEKIANKWWLLIPVAAYYFILILLLSPYLGDMKLPVRIYGIVISFMLLIALHLLFIKDNNSGMIILSGALLFILSDSLLAINKFYKPFAGADLLIMLTYGLAQLQIVRGVISYGKHRQRLVKDF
jgi:uncharacterized membrane protein YhhN